MYELQYDYDVGGWSFLYQGYPLYRGLDARQAIAYLVAYGNRPRVLKGEQPDGDL